MAGKEILVRARFQGVRDTGKLAFLTIRQGIATAQAIVTKATNPELFKFVTGGITKESFCDITATVTTPEKPVLSVSQGNIELQVLSCFVISKASPVLPFQLEDAARSDAQIAAREAEIKAAEAEGKTPPPAFPLVNPVSRRSPINKRSQRKRRHAIFSSPSSLVSHPFPFSLPSFLLFCRTRVLTTAGST